MNAQMNVLFATAMLGCLVTAGGADKPNPKKVMHLQITRTAFSEAPPIPAKDCDRERRRFAAAQVDPARRDARKHQKLRAHRRRSRRARRHVGALGALRPATQYDRSVDVE